MGRRKLLYSGGGVQLFAFFFDFFQPVCLNDMINLPPPPPRRRWWLLLRFLKPWYCTVLALYTFYFVHRKGSPLALLVMLPERCVADVNISQLLPVPLSVYRWRKSAVDVTVSVCRCAFDNKNCYALISLFGSLFMLHT